MSNSSEKDGADESMHVPDNSSDWVAHSVESEGSDEPIPDQKSTNYEESSVEHQLVPPESQNTKHLDENMRRDKSDVCGVIPESLESRKQDGIQGAGEVTEPKSSSHAIELPVSPLDSVTDKEGRAMLDGNDSEVFYSVMGGGGSRKVSQHADYLPPTSASLKISNSKPSTENTLGQSTSNPSHTSKDISRVSGSSRPSTTIPGQPPEMGGNTAYHSEKGPFSSTESNSSHHNGDTGNFTVSGRSDNVNGKIPEEKETASASNQRSEVIGSEEIEMHPGLPEVSDLKTLSLSAKVPNVPQSHMSHMSMQPPQPQQLQQMQQIQQQQMYNSHPTGVPATAIDRRHSSDLTHGTMANLAMAPSSAFRMNMNPDIQQQQVNFMNLNQIQAQAQNVTHTGMSASLSGSLSLHSPAATQPHLQAQAQSHILAPGPQGYEAQQHLQYPGTAMPSAPMVPMQQQQYSSNANYGPAPMYIQTAYGIVPVMNMHHNHNQHQHQRYVQSMPVSARLSPVDMMRGGQAQVSMPMSLPMSPMPASLNNLAMPNPPMYGHSASASTATMPAYGHGHVAYPQGQFESLDPTNPVHSLDLAAFIQNQNHHQMQPDPEIEPTKATPKVKKVKKRRGRPPSYLHDEEEGPPDPDYKPKKKHVPVDNADLVEHHPRRKSKRPSKLLDYAQFGDGDGVESDEDKK